MKRHEVRQKALQALFQIELGRAEVRDAIAHVMEDETATPANFAYIERLVIGTVTNLQEIDEMLTGAVTGWQLDRIAKVDFCVLRLASYELFHELDVDVATIADEAVELAKTYSTDESGRFVNGVLARIIPLAEQRRAESQHAE